MERTAKDTAADIIHFHRGMRATEIVTKNMFAQHSNNYFIFHFGYPMPTLVFKVLSSGKQSLTEILLLRSKKCENGQLRGRSENLIENLRQTTSRIIY